MATGKVKFFKEDRGFGFIQGDDGTDYFIYWKSIPNGVVLKSDDRVSFGVKPGKKGPEAIDIVIEGAQPAAPPQRSPVFGRETAAAPEGTFAYAFVPRNGGKAAPKAFHHQQEAERLDIAFEVVWTTQTPTALQPCEEPDVDESAVGKRGENTGYNKRWLTIDGKPAISPFTVKGAVANGIANLLGGCYRVPDREVGHDNSNDPSTFPYTGVWKRYRVSMNSKSLPGIIQTLKPESGDVTVLPVIEYYLDVQNLPDWLKPGMTCQAEWNHPLNRHKRPETNKRIITPGTIKEYTTGAPTSYKRPALVYYGEYFFGMDLTLQPGEHRKKHYHRFYEVSGGQHLAGKLDPLAFASLPGLQEKVYTGNFSKSDPSLMTRNADPRTHLLGRPWYENLRGLKPGDWCYYTAFDDADGKPKIAAIGKNFQFKALFNHQQALPPGNETCTDPDNLCPRCALFGLADKSEGNGIGKDAVGYAGRFRAATLISDVPLTAETPMRSSIPRVEKQGENFLRTSLPVTLSSFFSGEREVIRQVVLPIMGAPKPSKRDVNGYFDQNTGAVKGAKRYHHAALIFDESLPKLIQETDRNERAEGEEKMPYAHQMRPVASVCREGVNFAGTLGAENCSAEEIAALLALLDRRVAGHAFKLGLGKNVGLGSVASRIKKVWLRQPAQGWQSFEMPAGEGSAVKLFNALGECLPATMTALGGLLKESKAKLHPLKDAKHRLKFAKADQNYWKTAGVETVRT